MISRPLFDPGTYRVPPGSAGYPLEKNEHAVFFCYNSLASLLVILRESELRDPIRPGFMVLKSSVLVSLRIGFGTPNVPDLPCHKNSTFLAMITNIWTSPLLGRTSIGRQHSTGH